MSDYPKIQTVGLAGILVTFAPAMSEAANRAAIAFRAVVDQADWPEVSETSSSLVSTFLKVDLITHRPEPFIERLRDMLSAQNWLEADLPTGRTLWHVPTVFGTDLAPQLEEAAEAAGVDPDTAIRELSTSRVRVLTIGFAPGQPYLGMLPDHWNIPRQASITPSVPAGALIVAVAQFVHFTSAAPTGWRHVGQTAFRNFRKEHEAPFSLSPGDELVFPSIPRAEYDALKNAASNGGADREAI